MAVTKFTHVSIAFAYQSIVGCTFHAYDVLLASSKIPKTSLIKNAAILANSKYSTFIPARFTDMALGRSVRSGGDIKISSNRME